MIFGTDGIRGIVNNTINTQLAYDIGRAYAKYILKHKLIKKIFVGRDTRNSGDTYASAIFSGLLDYGIDIVYVGIVSTPIISFLISRNNVGGGIMITASHNDYTYNGIKIFSEIGKKLSKKAENEIENLINIKKYLPKVKGCIKYNRNYIDDYFDYVLDECKTDLSNYSIVIDCANGSNYYIAPYLYRKLGANVIKCSCDSCGLNINKNCGANHIENLRREVLVHNADFGIAFDGDGDRLRIVLGNGKILDGDDILFVLAKQLKKEHKLKNDTIVGTIMSNYGLEEALQRIGIKLLRSDVGDKNVIDLMQKNNLYLGGEPSGHICLYEHNCTCDALFNSLFFFNLIVKYNLDIEKEVALINRRHSILKNIIVSKKNRSEWDSNNSIHHQIDSLRQKYEDYRIIVRPSGTEPVIRLYVEGIDIQTNKLIADNLTEIISDLNKD